MGRIFLVWFGLARQVWLFGCSLVDIWQTKMHNSPSKLSNSYKIGITSGVKYTMVPVYLNLMDSKLDGNMFHSITLILMQFALLLTTQLQPNSTDLPNIFPLWFGGPNIFFPLQPVPTLLSIEPYKRKATSERLVIHVASLIGLIW